MTLFSLNYITSLAGKARDELQEMSLFARATAVGIADMCKRMVLLHYDKRAHVCESDMDALRRCSELSEKELEEKILSKQLSQDLEAQPSEGEIIILQMRTDKPAVTDAISVSEEYLATVRMLSYTTEHYTLISNTFNCAVTAIANLSTPHEELSDSQINHMHTLLYNMLRNRYFVLDKLILDTRIHAHYHVNESIQMLLLMQRIVRGQSEHNKSLLDMQELYTMYTQSGNALRMKYYTPREQKDVIEQMQHLSCDKVLVHNDTVRAVQILLAITARKDVQQAARIELSFAREKYIRYMLAQARKHTTFHASDALATLSCQLMYTRLAQVLQVCYTHGALVCYCDRTLFYEQIHDASDKEYKSLSVILNIIRYSNDIMLDVVQQLAAHVRANAVIHFINSRTAITLDNIQNIIQAMRQNSSVREQIIARTINTVLTDNIESTVQQHLQKHDINTPQQSLQAVVKQVFSFTHEGTQRNGAIKAYVQTMLNDELLNLHNDMIFMRYAQVVANNIVHIHSMSMSSTEVCEQSIDVTEEEQEVYMSYSDHNLTMLANMFKKHDPFLSTDNISNRLMHTMITNRQMELYVQSLSDAGNMLKFESHFLHLSIQDTIEKICACAREELMASGLVLSKQITRTLMGATCIYGLSYVLRAIYTRIHI